MPFEVHREPLYRRYYASSFSGACCYAISFGFVLIFLPLIIAYNSSYFWLKEDIVYEQPKVDYQYQSIVQLHGTRDGAPMSLFYSTSKSINELNAGHLRMPLLKSAELDDNRDGKIDRIELSVQMPLAPTETVNSFTALVYCNSQISSKARYIFDTVSYINYESMSAMMQLNMDGDFLLRQTWPLSAKGGFRTPYSDDPLLDLTSSTSAADVSISRILQRYSARNLTMQYRSNFENVQRHLSAVPSDHSLPNYFNASVIIRVPIQPIRYTPPVSAVLKNAWIQYLAFFAVVSFLLFRLNSFVFRHKLLQTHTTADIVYEKMD